MSTGSYINVNIPVSCCSGLYPESDRIILDLTADICAHPDLRLSCMSGVRPDLTCMSCVGQILYRQTNRGIKYEYAIKREDSLSSVLPRLPTEQGLVPAVQLPSHSGLPPGRSGHRNALPAPSTTLSPGGSG